MASSIAELTEEARALDTLDAAFRWGISKQPRITPEDVVIQDEFTHDVLFRISESAYLVFDST